MSALAIRSRASSCPSSDRRSTATEHLLRAMTRHQLGRSPWPQWRIWSPVSGGSSLTISAPMSPRSWPQKGPAINCRSEEHTSELQSLMRISYAVFCLKKKNQNNKHNKNDSNKHTNKQQQQTNRSSHEVVISMTMNVRRKI